MKQATIMAMRALLAEFYPDVATIRRVLHDAGMDAARLPLNATLLDLWHAVLIEAEKGGQLAALLEIAKGEYGDNPRFQALYRTFVDVTEPLPAERQPEPSTPHPLEQPITWLRQRPALGLGGLALVILLAALLWWNLDRWRPAAPVPFLCPADRHCLLVADFAPADHPLAAEITRKIKSELDSQEQLAPTLFAVRQTGAITDVVAARHLANREQALVVVWGEIFSTLQQMKIFFALTDQFGVGESRQVRPYRAEFFEAIAQQLDCQQRCFADVATLGTTVDQISAVIAYTAAGLLQYANDQPEAANRDFTAALLCSGQPVDLPIADAAITPATPVTVTATLDTRNALPACVTDQAIPGFNPASIYYYAGKAKILVGDYATALAYLQHAAALNAKDPAAWIAIATAYQSWLNQDDAAQALTALEEARQRANVLRAELVSRKGSPQVAAVDYELGFIAELAGDLTTAQAKYTAAVEGFGRRNPDAYVALLALGRVQRLDNQVEAAIATVQQARDLDKNAPWAYLELAQLYDTDPAKAKVQVQAARQVAPNQPAVSIIEAALCEQWQDYGCAEAAYARAVEQRPTSGWLQGRIGDFYRLREDWQQAATHYELAVQIRPNDPWAHDRLAFAYLQLGTYAEAATHYALTLDLSHPQNRVAERSCALGQAQDLAGESQVALANYRLCIDGLTDATQHAIVEERIADIEAAP